MQKTGTPSPHADGATHDTGSRLWYHIVTALIGMTIATSAYMVYHNTAARLPICVSFFWFSLFATIGAFLYPNDLLGAFLLPGVAFKERFRLLYPEAPWKAWQRSLKQGGRLILFATTVSYVLYFVCLLSSLRVRQPGVVITVLVLQQIKPLLVALAGFLVLGDTCKRWWGYVLGTALTSGGVLLYKFALGASAHIQFFDAVFFLACATLVFDVFNQTVRARYRRDYHVDAREAMKSTQIVATLTALAWMLADGVVWPERKEFLGLLYLGFVPTACAGILVQRAQDQIGMPLIGSIGSLRPVLLLLLGILPIPWFSTGMAHLGWTQYGGIVLAIVGLLVVIWVACPVPTKMVDPP